MPGATTPNRPAYRDNPEETNKLQRQANELMEKGYVRESMSRCAILVLFVHRRMERGGCALIAEPSTT